MRVVTINTWKGDGSYRRRMADLVTGLRTLDADIICCQEVFESADGKRSTASTLASALGLSVAHARGRVKPRLVEDERVLSSSGLAVFSRWPFLEVATRALAADPADGDRAALFCAVDTPGGVLRVGNVHLTHLRDADDLREEQWAQVVGDPWWQGDADLRLLCGDLNSTPGSRLQQRIRTQQRPWRAVDILATCGMDEAATLSASNPYLSERAAGRSMPDRRVDYIYSFASETGRHARAIAARIVLDGSAAGGGVVASDHFGIAVDVE